MSTGIELIPIALMGLIHIAKIVKESLQEAESTGTLKIDTRMTDTKLIDSSLFSLGFNVTHTGAVILVSDNALSFQLERGESGSFIAVSNTPEQFQSVGDILVQFEKEYVRHLQESIIHEITSNATNLGYSVTQEALPNASVRLSVKVTA